MNVLDENIPLDQRDLLRTWGIRCRVIGQDIARLSIGDDNILTLLHRLKQPTLFTRDEHFFKRRLCHPSYGVVWLDLAPEEAALFIRRVLRHPRLGHEGKPSGLGGSCSSRWPPVLAAEQRRHPAGGLDRQRVKCPTG